MYFRIKQRNGGKSWLFQERKNKEYSKGWRWAVCGNNGRCCRRRSKAFLCCNVHRKCFEYIHMPESSSSQMKRKENDEEKNILYIKKIYICICICVYVWRSFPSARNGWKKPKGICQCTRCQWIFMCVCVRASFFKDLCMCVLARTTDANALRRGCSKEDAEKMAKKRSHRLQNTLRKGVTRSFISKKKWI